MTISFRADKLQEARENGVCCPCLGDKRDGYTKREGHLTFVHSKCELPAWGVLHECQVCESLYEPSVYPDYDEVCHACSG